MDFPTDVLYEEIQQLCGVKLKVVVAGFLETWTAAPHLPAGFRMYIWY